MSNELPLCDVVQIGCGPVSEIMALALARQGRRVAVFERYPMPRAVCIDHELYRVLSALGMGEQLPAVSHAGPQYRWFNVELNLGWEAVEATQTADHVELIVRDLETEERRTVRAKYLIGADGANSLVRQTIGGTQEDRGFEADWLVIDVLPNEGVTLGIPPAPQYCTRRGRPPSCRRASRTAAISGAGSSCACRTRAARRSRTSTSPGTCWRPG